MGDCWEYVRTLLAAREPIFRQLMGSKLKYPCA